MRDLGVRAGLSQRRRARLGWHTLATTRLGAPGVAASAGPSRVGDAIWIVGGLAPDVAAAEGPRNPRASGDDPRACGGGIHRATRWGMELRGALSVGAVLLERYELLREIGRGGCAVVFEAHDHRLGRTVAIKFPLNAVYGRASRFTRETQLVARVHHPNVCAVLDSGVAEDGTPFLVMERLYGESLRAVLASRGSLGIREAIAMGLQLLSALDAVHEAGIVHRDVKPDNIVLVSRGGCDPLVKLLDFGLGRRAARRREAEETMTSRGAIIGTPEYMAPEQVLGSALDVRVDVYAVGVVLYESLTGDRAFFSKNVRDILSGVITKRIPPLRERRPDAPRSLESVLLRAMSRDPARRHASALELQQDLIAVKEEMDAEAAARLVQRERQSGVRALPEVSALADAWDAPTTKYVKRSPPKRPGSATGTDG